MSEITKKIKVKRAPKRGHYDHETIHQIVDKDFLCHIGFIHEGYPVVIPTLYGRKENHLYIHGASASRMMKNLEEGVSICLTITLVNGLVLARSAFHHSMNYESVVVFGKAVKVEGEEKLEALKVINDQVIEERWEEVRAPNAKEMKATLVLKIPLDEASAKIRTGGPKDDKEDYELDIWAGELPISRRYHLPVNDPLMIKELGIPASVKSMLDKSSIK